MNILDPYQIFQPFFKYVPLILLSKDFCFRILCPQNKTRNKKRPIAIGILYKIEEAISALLRQSVLDIIMEKDYNQNEKWFNAKPTNIL